MVTFQAGRVALLSLLAGLATAACSQEQEDWRSAEGADTTEAWQRFVEQHPDSELVGQARTRIAQLEVQRDFRVADYQGTVDAYREFLAHHPSGKWAEPIQPAGVPADTGQPETAAGADSRSGTGRAVPGEAAQAAPETVVQPASSNETSRNTGYGVQLGAFGSEASADREWHRLRGRFGAELGNLSPRIVVAESDSGQFYRLQAPASGEAQARAICDSLKEQEQACIPVVPR